MDDVFFKKYKNLKNNFNIKYTGYHLDGLMAKDFIYFAYKMQQHSLTKSFIKEKLFYANAYDDFKDLLYLKKIIFCFDNYGRDHKTLMETIMEEVNESVLFEPHDNSKKHINVINIIVSFSQLFITSKLKVSQSRIDFISF
jgi:hypothetical protein